MPLNTIDLYLRRNYLERETNRWFVQPGQVRAISHGPFSDIKEERIKKRENERLEKENEKLEKENEKLEKQRQMEIEERKKQRTFELEKLKLQNENKVMYQTSTEYDTNAPK
ncbi:hypothetical protein CEXT_528511 [Caerostris extrusa]|uniref:Uncharacterized protein n=1 Tax=Caerostris extrusa TaxID=172846 RepID=A0AAV4V838_CAEEX|nr:hypothetical protein CEXT_528511 [Caerostris extrusa]